MNQKIIELALINIAAAINKFNQENKTYRAFMPQEIMFDFGGETRLKFAIPLDRKLPSKTNKETHGN